MEHRWSDKSSIRSRTMLIGIIATCDSQMGRKDWWVSLRHEKLIDLQWLSKCKPCLAYVHRTAFSPSLDVAIKVLEHGGRRNWKCSEGVEWSLRTYKYMHRVIWPIRLVQKCELCLGESVTHRNILLNSSLFAKLKGYCFYCRRGFQPSSHHTQSSGTDGRLFCYWLNYWRFPSIGGFLDKSDKRNTLQPLRCSEADPKIMNN